MNRGKILLVLVQHCNNRKGDRTPGEAGLSLHVRPFKPSHIVFIKNVVGRIDEKWKPYLYLS